MIRGLEIAGMGMNVQATKLNVISNNLANVNTTGYKKDTPVVSAFESLFLLAVDKKDNKRLKNEEIGSITLGTYIDTIYTSFTQGGAKQTGRDLDLTLQGEGFFEVNTPMGSRYTRDGSFEISNDGYLVTKEGYRVIGQNGELNLDRDKSIVINEVGEIYQEDTLVSKLSINNFSDLSGLQKVGDNLYEVDQVGIPFEGKVIQGSLEVSNVNPVSAMVEMIAVSRAYEANQKMIQTHDALLGKIVNEV